MQDEAAAVPPHEPLVRPSGENHARRTPARRDDAADLGHVECDGKRIPTVGPERILGLDHAPQKRLHALGEVQRVVRNHAFHVALLLDDRLTHVHSHELRRHLKRRLPPRAFIRACEKSA